MSTVISVESLSKSYRLGQIGTGTFTNDLKIWWAKTHGKPNPLLKIGETNHGNRDGETIWALKDINFTVKRGEVLGIIGKNGAGKSTLLKILSRVTAPTTGKVKVKGRIASLLEVGTGFHPELTGRENIYLNGSILGMKKTEIDRKFDEIVDFSGVEKFIDTPVKRYSSGMYVRLAFAVAAHLEPEILLVDEVLAVGDAEFQKKCLGKMGKVAREGRTVLFVSHNMAMVSSLCQRAILVNEGSVFLDGDTNEVIEEYVRNIQRKVSVLLKDRSDRRGTGVIRITKLEVCKRGGQVGLGAIRSGDDLEFALSYETDSSQSNVFVSLGFFTIFDQCLMICQNEMTSGLFDYVPTKGKFRCIIPHFPLSPGTYKLNVMCRSKDVVADWIQSAATLHVLAGDFFKTGFLPPKSHGGFLAPHSWKIQECA